MQWIVAFDREQVEAMKEMLAYYSDRAAHLRPVLSAIVDDFHDGERSIFASAGASDGLDWPPIKADTIRRHPDHRAPMRMTDVLFKSLTTSHSKYSIATIREDEVIVGTRDPVANVHQHKQRHGEGSSAARFGGSAYTNAERRVMYVSWERTDHWFNLLADHLLGDIDEDDTSDLNGRVGV